MSLLGGAPLFRIPPCRPQHLCSVRRLASLWFCMDDLDINPRWLPGSQEAIWSPKISLNTSLAHPKQTRVVTFGMQLVNNLGNQPPGATPPAVGPQLSPEERAYNAERSRIAQLTEQNPEFQNIGQLRNDLRDQGMAIWAAKYGGPGGLASKVKPGAVGYDAIQRGIGIQSIPSLENRAEFGLDQLTQGPTPAVPMADEMLNPASPGFIGGEGAPPMNFADPRFENMSPEDFQKLLNQVNRK